MDAGTKTGGALSALSLAFLGLAAAFYFNLWGNPRPLPEIPLVDTNFISTATARQSAVDLARSEGDMSNFECYVCHDKKNPPKLKFDAEGNVIVPKEHDDIVIAHGRHHRNNNCFNCHDENNLEALQT